MLSPYVTEYFSLLVNEMWKMIHVEKRIFFFAWKKWKADLGKEDPFLAGKDCLDKETVRGNNDLEGLRGQWDLRPAMSSLQLQLLAWKSAGNVRGWVLSERMPTISIGGVRVRARYLRQLIAYLGTCNLCQQCNVVTFVKWEPRTRCSTEEQGVNKEVVLLLLWPWWPTDWPYTGWRCHSGFLPLQVSTTLLGGPSSHLALCNYAYHTSYYAMDQTLSHISAGQSGRRTALPLMHYNPILQWAFTWYMPIYHPISPQIWRHDHTHIFSCRQHLISSHVMWPHSKLISMTKVRPKGQRLAILSARWLEDIFMKVAPSLKATWRSLPWGKGQPLTFIVDMSTLI